MTRKDMLLLFMASATSGIPLGRAHIHNAMFTLGKSNIPELPDPYYLFDYDYIGSGYRCRDIDADVQSLCEHGKLFLVPANYDHAMQKGAYSRWSVSVDGWYSALSIMEDRGFSMSTTEYIRQLAEWCKMVSSMQADMAVSMSFPPILEVQSYE